MSVASKHQCDIQPACPSATANGGVSSHADSLCITRKLAARHGRRGVLLSNFALVVARCARLEPPKISAVKVCGEVVIMRPRSVNDENRGSVRTFVHCARQYVAVLMSCLAYLSAAIKLNVAYAGVTSSVNVRRRRRQVNQHLINGVYFLAKNAVLPSAVRDRPHLASAAPA